MNSCLSSNFYWKKGIFISPVSLYIIVPIPTSYTKYYNCGSICWNYIPKQLRPRLDFVWDWFACNVRNVGMWYHSMINQVYWWNDTQGIKSRLKDISTVWIQKIIIYLLPSVWNTAFWHDIFSTLSEELLHTHQTSFPSFPLAKTTEMVNNSYTNFQISRTSLLYVFLWWLGLKNDFVCLVYWNISNANCKRFNLVLCNILPALLHQHFLYWNNSSSKKLKLLLHLEGM